MSDAATEPRGTVAEDAAAATEAIPPAPPAGMVARVTALRTTDTGKALGLAAATMAANGLAVIFTIVFARILGTGDYGSLGALLNLSVIINVPGLALQVAAAREGTLGRLGSGAELSATVERWTRHLVMGMLGIVVVSVLARHQLAALVDVEEHWAAAAVPVAGCAWLLLSAQRGVLQATRHYKAVGYSVIIEAFGRLLAGLALVGAGAGVTGAYLGTPLSMLACATVLAFILRRHLGTPDLTSPPHPLTSLARDARYPIAGLAIVALLQNADVIMAKHQLSDDDAGVYAAAAVAGKAVVWIAVGVGLYLLPEATRRAAAGLDPRKALARALIIIGVIALPALALFAGVPGLLLELAFGPEYRRGDDILLLIGIGFAALATTYLAVQYLLGLGWRAFMLPLAVAAAVEPAILLSADDLISFARTLLIVQLVAAAVAMAICVRAKAPRAGTT